ncbi:MAG TPA: hypothetical protein VL588_04160 [Bdellovibrionota bacterium]|jgi:hypothetical protein|nr:hypothetical protein [Bdellovibrionota bacterium]
MKANRVFSGLCALIALGATASPARGDVSAQACQTMVDLGTAAFEHAWREEWGLRHADQARAVALGLVRSLSSSDLEILDLYYANQLDGSIAYSLVVDHCNAFVHDHATAAGEAYCSVSANSDATGGNLYVFVPGSGVEETHAILLLELNRMPAGDTAAREAWVSSEINAWIAARVGRQFGAPRIGSARQYLSTVAHVPQECLAGLSDSGPPATGVPSASVSSADSSGHSVSQVEVTLGPVTLEPTHTGAGH